MPHPVSVPETIFDQFVAIASSLPSLPSALNNVSSPADDQIEAVLPPNSNNLDAPAPACPSILEEVAPDAVRAITPTDKVSVLFAAPPSDGAKKRKRNHLSDDGKVDSALAAVEGVCRGDPAACGGWANGRQQ